MFETLIQCSSTSPLNETSWSTSHINCAEGLSLCDFGRLLQCHRCWDQEGPCFCWCFFHVLFFPSINCFFGVCVCFFFLALPRFPSYFKGIGCFRWHVGCFYCNSCVERPIASLPCNAIRIKVAIRKIFRRWEHAAHEPFGDVFRGCLFDWPGCWYMMIWTICRICWGSFGGMQISSTTSRVFVLTLQELTNAYEKIMEQRRGSDDKGYKVCPFFSDLMGWWVASRMGFQRLSGHSACTEWTSKERRLCLFRTFGRCWFLLVCDLGN